MIPSEGIGAYARFYLEGRAIESHIDIHFEYPIIIAAVCINTLYKQKVGEYGTGIYQLLPS